jgi:hypothetical protein
MLPGGFHRIRYYGLFASAVRARNIDRVRQLLAVSTAHPRARPRRPTATPKHLRLHIDARVAGAG